MGMTRPDPVTVIPAKAGIRGNEAPSLVWPWTPVFAGATAMERESRHV